MDINVAERRYDHGMTEPAQITEHSEAYPIVKEYAICTLSVQGLSMVLRQPFVVIGREGHSNHTVASIITATENQKVVYTLP